MAYYKDLTPYEYGMSAKGIVNIGWLENGNPYPRGNFPEKQKILRILKSMKTSHLCRGFHCCDLCEMPAPRGSEGMSQSLNHGNGEYRVGRFSSPDLIIHYMEDHNYRPPQEFIDAVLVA